MKDGQRLADMAHPELDERSGYEAYDSPGLRGAVPLQDPQRNLTKTIGFVPHSKQPPQHGSKAGVAVRGEIRVAVLQAQADDMAAYQIVEVGVGKIGYRQRRGQECDYRLHIRIGHSRQLKQVFDGALSQFLPGAPGRLSQHLGSWVERKFDSTEFHTGRQDRLHRLRDIDPRVLQIRLNTIDLRAMDPTDGVISQEGDLFFRRLEVAAGPFTAGSFQG